MGWDSILLILEPLLLYALTFQFNIDTASPSPPRTINSSCTSPNTQKARDCFPAYPLTRGINPRYTTYNPWFPHQRYVKLSWHSGDHGSVIARKFCARCRYGCTAPEVIRPIFEEGGGSRRGFRSEEAAATTGFLS